jgi:NAD(P)H-hydrate epimerase
MAAVDAAAIDAGLPGVALMETAGRAVTAAIIDRWGETGRARILVGKGNNGGDGLVVARTLVAGGWEVELALFCDPAELIGDAGAQWALVEPMGLVVERIESASQAAALGRPHEFTCGVDALLGTGLRGDVREPMSTAIRALNEGPLPVVAVDAPSGLDGSTGRPHGVTVRAELTVTFGFPKPGLFLGAGPAHTGHLIVAPLGYPPGALEAAGPAPLEWSGLEHACAALPPLASDAHKGSAGRLLLVAGSEEYRGAAVLAATAALRSGVGLCTVATPASIAEFIVGTVPEVIVESLPVTDAGELSSAAAERVARLTEHIDAIAIGPGLGGGAKVRTVVEAAIAADAPLIVDADGLNALADAPETIRRDPPTVTTPHPGELARWLKDKAEVVDADRIEAAPRAADRWGVHVVLKGAPTVIADPDGRAALNLTGNPGLATGGSGDVLTGLLGALLAQGVAAPLAARAAPLLHGLAADWAAHDLGERGLVPSDLFRYLPLTIRELIAGRGPALLDRIDHRYAALLTNADAGA